MAYTVIKAASREDKDRIEDFVHDHFLPDMPLIRAFGLEHSPPPRAPSPPKPTPDTEDFYLMAVDAQGNLVGVAINRVTVTFHLNTETPPEVKKMVEFLNFVEEEAELTKLPERTIELRVLSVHKDWRKKGIAKRLAEESMRVARESGFEAMKVCCTNEFTARLARALGWREHYRLAYEDYSKLSGTNVCLKPTPPHYLIYYYVTDL